ncbi:MarR family winged helix-turn-helix transcriptional regulator [Massilia sp. YIM B02769]|nr:MarR family winged helix-turn-helix transcriptional regulator [Massilia sp. YIM B02769]
MRKQVDKVNQNPSGTVGDVFDAIHSIMHLYRSQQFRAFAGAEHELTHMESKVLRFFARQPGATLSDLVAHSGRDKAQLTRLIKGLRDRGLLDASADAADRRSTRLHLSAAGLALHGRLHQIGAGLSGVALEGLSEAEREQLHGLLLRVRSNLARDAEG